MGGIADRYCENIHKNIEPYYATWIPSLPIRVGDYGKMDGKIFIRQGNIKTGFGVDFSVLNDQDSGDYEYKSSGVNVIKIGGGTGIGEVAKVGLKFSFSSQYEIFFLAANCLADMMEDSPAVIDKLRPIFKQKQMKGYRIVTQAIKAGASTVMVSSAKQSELVIEAKSEEIKEIDLKGPEASFSLKSEKTIGFKVLAKVGLVPLLALEEVK